jgi:two-component system, OmpR family, response regulator
MDESIPRATEDHVNIKKVLLIDDDADVRRIGSMSLRKLGGFDVLLASSGAEGLMVAEQSLPDLILLDIIMPGLDGMVTITELKKASITKAIPVIFLTGARDLSPPEKVREVGALGVIFKPLDPLRLPYQARELVEASRAK